MSEPDSPQLSNEREARIQDVSQRQWTYLKGAQCPAYLALEASIASAQAALEAQSERIKSRTSPLKALLEEIETETAAALDLVSGDFTEELERVMEGLQGICHEQGVPEPLEALATLRTALTVVARVQEMLAQEHPEAMEEAREIENHLRIAYEKAQSL